MRHREALWSALAEGQADLICSGHLPVRAETKDRPYPGTHPGLPTIEWILPLLLDRVGRGLMSLSEIARWTAEAPAHAMRVPRKGRLETGYDGDLVLVDLELTRTVGVDAPIQSSCAWSPWADTALTAGRSSPCSSERSCFATESSCWSHGGAPCSRTWVRGAAPLDRTWVRGLRLSTPRHEGAAATVPPRPLSWPE